MSWKSEETKKVKEALKRWPYKIKVVHGKGTGSGWLKIYIPYEKWETDHQIVEGVVAWASGREGHEVSRERILVTHYGHY